VPQYPDPNLVVYPTTAPPPFPPQLTTREAGKLYPVHDHCAFVDVKGDGNTDVVASHFHYVRDSRVLPDPSDGHKHDLTGLPCGAGGAVGAGRGPTPAFFKGADLASSVAVHKAEELRLRGAFMQHLQVSKAALARRDCRAAFSAYIDADAALARIVSERRHTGAAAPLRPAADLARLRTELQRTCLK
jgi:hypothetical protein